MSRRPVAQLQLITLIFLLLGLSYAFYNLANNLEHQNKCREEINRVLRERKNVEM